MLGLPQTISHKDTLGFHLRRFCSHLNRPHIGGDGGYPLPCSDFVHRRWLQNRESRVALAKWDNPTPLKLRRMLNFVAAYGRQNWQCSDFPHRCCPPPAFAMLRPASPERRRGEQGKQVSVNYLPRCSFSGSGWQASLAQLSNAKCLYYIIMPKLVN
jgi:hypothetical protein